MRFRVVSQAVTGAVLVQFRVVSQAVTGAFSDQALFEVTSGAVGFFSLN